MYSLSNLSRLSFVFKAEWQASIQFLLNWMLWQSLHSLQHQNSMLIETQLQEKGHDNLHTDSSVQCSSETSSTLEKKDQLQVKDNSSFFFRNTISEHDSLNNHIFLLKSLGRKLHNFKNTKIKLLIKILLISSDYSTRGPPTIYFSSISQ